MAKAETATQRRQPGIWPSRITAKAAAGASTMWVLPSVAGPNAIIHAVANPKMPTTLSALFKWPRRMRTMAPTAIPAAADSNMNMDRSIGAIHRSQVNIKS